MVKNLVFIASGFQSIEGFVNNVKEITDHVDILINNAGIAGKLGER
jgi:NADP-dependent 3-hydroxy acid dehydrogenase YdfG